MCYFVLGSSIECYTCNSYTDAHCGDPFFFEDKPNEMKNPDALKACDADTEDKKHFCRKIYQNGKHFISYIWKQNFQLKFSQKPMAFSRNLNVFYCM